MADPIIGTLASKLAAIRREVKRIEKRGENTHFHYKYMRAEDVAGDLGDLFAERNIVIGRRNGKTTITAIPDSDAVYVTVECEYVFTDGDTLEEFVVWATGTEKGDKASFKSQTGALKYALTQMLCMRVGDDPEQEDSPSPRTPTTEATRPVYTGGRVAAMEDVGVLDPNRDATDESKAALLRLVMKQTGESAAFATDWILGQCKSRWGMTTTSDGQGGQRLTNKLQNRHVQELTKMILEDPAETF